MRHGQQDPGECCKRGNSNWNHATEEKRPAQLSPIVTGHAIILAVNSGGRRQRFASWTKGAVWHGSHSGLRGPVSKPVVIASRSRKAPEPEDRCGKIHSQQITPALLVKSRSTVRFPARPSCPMAVQQVLDAKSASRLRNVGHRPHQTFGRFHAGLPYLHAEEIVAFLWKVPIAKNARVTAYSIE